MVEFREYQSFFVKGHPHGWVNHRSGRKDLDSDITIPALVVRTIDYTDPPSTDLRKNPVMRQCLHGDARIAP